MIYTLPTIGVADVTDNEWGRLYKFNTTGDSGLICPYRSYYFRDFIAGNWQDISIGMIHCEMGNGGGDTANLVAERLNEITPANLFHFGLSKSSNGTIPVTVNPWFVGMRGIIAGVSQIMTSPLQLAQLTMIATQNGATVIDTNLIQLPLSQGVSGTPFSRVGIRFIYDEINSRLHLNYAVDTGIALASDAANVTSLTNFLQGISSSTSGSFTSFPCTSITNFSSFYMFWPYLFNRIKLQCVGMIKNG